MTELSLEGFRTRGRDSTVSQGVVGFRADGAYMITPFEV